jgi:hypothetical protein
MHRKFGPQCAVRQYNWYYTRKLDPLEQESNG